MQGLLTDHITTNSGVKQGGKLSPRSFNIYDDDLMKELMDASLGCGIRFLHISLAF